MNWTVVFLHVTNAAPSLTRAVCSIREDLASMVPSGTRAILVALAVEIAARVEAARPA